MNTLIKNRPIAQTVRANNLKITQDDLTVYLEDGRTLTVPLEWFPRLQGASPADLNNWEWIGGGIGIHWPTLDEDLSVRGLLEAS